MLGAPGVRPSRFGPVRGPLPPWQLPIVAVKPNCTKLNIGTTQLWNHSLRGERIHLG
jgi:hypothetical protein